MNISYRYYAIAVTVCSLLSFGFGILFGCGNAHADEGTFLQDVSSRGIPAGPITLAVGHQVCTDVSLHGTSGFDSEVQQAISAGVSAHDTSVIIVVAVYDLCPSNMPALNAYLSDDREA